MPVNAVGAARRRTFRNVSVAAHPGSSILNAAAHRQCPRATPPRRSSQSRRPNAGVVAVAGRRRRCPRQLTEVVLDRAQDGEVGNRSARGTRSALSQPCGEHRSERRGVQAGVTMAMGATRSRRLEYLTVPDGEKACRRGSSAEHVVGGFSSTGASRSLDSCGATVIMVVGRVNHRDDVPGRRHPRSPWRRAPIDDDLLVVVAGRARCCCRLPTATVEFESAVVTTPFDASARLKHHHRAQDLTGVRIL